MPVGRVCALCLSALCKKNSHLLPVVALRGVLEGLWRDSRDAWTTEALSSTYMTRLFPTAPTILIVCLALIEKIWLLFTRPAKGIIAVAGGYLLWVAFVQDVNQPLAMKP